MTTSSLTISGRQVGAGHPPLVIAEISANHNGSLERALHILEAAKASGAEAVKFQTYTPDTITIDHSGDDFTIRGGLWHGRTLFELYREAHTPWSWHQALFAKARELGLIAFSSPFDETAVDFLETLNVPAYKIASFEIVDLDLIRRCAATRKPLIISTGMANLAEIDEAVRVAREAGATELALLHCTSGYPTPPEQSDLRTISHLAEAFGVTTGLSDHTLDIGVAIASVALGASIIEKHFTLSRQDGGADAIFSLEPQELEHLCHNVRLAWQALGHVRYERTEAELGNVQFRRSLYIVTDMKKGDVLTEAALRSIRPGHGLLPRFRQQLLGRTVTRDVARGTPLSWDLVS